MALNNKMKVVIISSTLLLSGCSMKSMIEKESGKELSEDKTISDLVEELPLPSKAKGEEETTDPQLDDIEMNEEQQKLLNQADSQMVQEAIKANKTNIARNVIMNIEEVPYKNDYSNAEEFAKYVGNELFKYHARITTGAQMYNAVKNHFHPEFLNQMPESENDRIEMFESLQQMFSAYLPKQIIDFQMTEVSFIHKQLEGYFYRKYTLNDGSNIFYMTTIRKDDKGHWKVLNDDPSDGYIEENAGTEENDQNN